MIGMREFYCIRVKTRDLKEVIAVYDSLEQKGFIEFRPAGIFSGYVDVICENYNLVVRLEIANISFSIKQQCSCYCVDANEVPGYTVNHKIDDNGNLACDLVTKEELDSATTSLRTGDNDKIRKEVMDILASIYSDEPETTPSAPESRKPELQRKKIQPRKVLDFKTEGKRTKWEIIKALQGEFEKFPDDTTFGSFTANGIGTFGTHYL